MKYKFIKVQRTVQLYINYHNRCEKQMYEIKYDAQKKAHYKIEYNLFYCSFIFIFLRFIVQESHMLIKIISENDKACLHYCHIRTNNTNNQMR